MINIEEIEQIDELSREKWDKAVELIKELLIKYDDILKNYESKALLIRKGEILKGNIYISKNTIYAYNGKVKDVIFGNNVIRDDASTMTMEEIEELFKEFEIYIPYSSIKE